MKRHNSDQIRYVIYARKSTEGEDRQVQSIDDQLTRLRELAANRGLLVVREYTEARSAKAPGNRAVFEELLGDIRAGKANGILCWHVNRLSRNPVDSGTVTWMLQTGVIQSIQTADREHRPDDNALLMSVENGMANQFIRELSKNVKRGLQGKLERGEFTSRAPVGYLNDRLAKTIVKDPERFENVRTWWKLLLSGNYTVGQIHRKSIAGGFTTVRRSKSGGTPLALSALYAVFANPFYAGLLRCGGRIYPGVHTAMISVDDFEKAQSILGRRDRPRPKKHLFTYSRVFRCAECGSFITAEHRAKRYKTTGRTATYTYYHCTHRKRGVTCQQRRCIPEADLTADIIAALADLSVPKAWLDFSLRVFLEGELPQNVKDQLLQRGAVEQAVRELERQLTSLTDLRLRDLIADDEFVATRQRLQDALTRESLRLQGLQSVDLGDLWKEVERTFLLAADATERFGEAGMELRREILTHLGSNFTVRDGKPTITWAEWVSPLVTKREGWMSDYRRFVLADRSMLPTKKDAFASSFPAWSGVVEEVITRLLGVSSRGSFR